MGKAEQHPRVPAGTTRVKMGMRSIDLLITVYLFLHGLLALVCDLQSVLPEDMLTWYKRAGLYALVQDWCNEQGDFLVCENPSWFKALIISEIVLQVPACFILGTAWLHRCEWARLPALCYSVHVMTTMIPILSALVVDPRPTVVCLSVYGIWLVLPALLAVRCISSSFVLFPAQARDLWKIALVKEVEEWESLGMLSGSDLDQADGFLHGSSATMVKKVAARFFAGKDAKLLKINSTLLPKGTVWTPAEYASDGELRALSMARRGDYVRSLKDGCLHLHMCEPLSMRAVEQIHDLRWKDGQHVFPGCCN